MYSDSATNLLDLSKSDVQQWLKTFDAVLTDCDGVLWHDNKPITGSPEAITALQQLGKRVYFVTNNGTKTRHALWQRACALGYHIREENIIAPTRSIVDYLQNRNFRQTVYVIGATSITEELTAAGIKHTGAGADVLDINVNDYIERELATAEPNVGAVVVGFDEHFSFGKVMKASNYLGTNEDCLFLATNADAVHRYPQYAIPGTGAILKAVETCVGRDALVLGKPNVAVCEGLLQDGTLVPQRTLMVGDCPKVDVTFGKNCGFQTLLVGTGSTQLADVLKMRVNLAENRQYIPDVYLEKLGDLLKFI